jgi:hypothetical protein
VTAKKAAKPAPAIPPLFRAALKAAGLPTPVAEYRFHPTRKFRYDYAWPVNLVCRSEAGNEFEAIEVNMPLALEQEGAVWVQGRHTRGSGFVKDMEKYNEAAALGWRILRVQPNQLCAKETMDLIRRALDV